MAKKHIHTKRPHGPDWGLLQQIRKQNRVILDHIANMDDKIANIEMIQLHDAEANGFLDYDIPEEDVDPTPAVSIKKVAEYLADITKKREYAKPLTELEIAQGVIQFILGEIGLQSLVEVQF
jgi:hypothetical protein